MHKKVESTVNSFILGGLRKHMHFKKKFQTFFGRRNAGFVGFMEKLYCVKWTAVFA